jgi:hypothetical protein
LIFERQRGHWFFHGGHTADVREIHPRLRRNLSRSSSARLRPVTSIAVRWLTPVSRFGFRIQSGQRRLCCGPLFVVLNFDSRQPDSTRLIRCISTPGSPTCLPSEVCVPCLLHCPFEGVNMPLGQTQVSRWVFWRDHPLGEANPSRDESNESRSQVLTDQTSEEFCKTGRSSRYLKRQGQAGFSRSDWCNSSGSSAWSD